MKKVTLLALTLILILSSCGSYESGELTGVQGRKKFYEPEPFEMAFIPAGSFIQGPSDQDPLRAMNPEGEPLDEIMAYVRRKLELSRDYLAPAVDSIGKASERELLVRELRRDMAAAILRRVDAASKPAAAAAQ